MTVDEAILNALGEPTLRSLGLGSYWFPSGWFQLIFESLHVNLNLPWYASILVFTLVLRTLLIPISIRIRKNNVLMKKSSSAISKAKAKQEQAESIGNEIKSKRKKLLKFY